ncbi:hypothetical protein TIFTF001_033521 [Ficus carica]|uniref:non-specific serine/threonine protein kinase n=1 Tax=Ficus carica TaxID=3494 RepID=A0AA88DZ01_FICCA|nr:hypothetical protein TIFTF001_033521 [Ficus carica]
MASGQLLSGNRLNGSIPEEIGEITTLEELVIENNLLGGPLPPKLGSLSNLQRLTNTRNIWKFKELNRLVSHPSLFIACSRIDGTGISGKIPSFIGNWTKLNKLDMQGTSMEGPIPPTISLLRNLAELRITDLWGSAYPFPNLEELKLLKTLVLRNCLIEDQIPLYIREMTELELLDLSFNRLTGVIPQEMQSLRKLKYMFLSNNSLTGEAPSWIESRNGVAFDLSYNNFTGSTKQLSCTDLSPNLISSYLSEDQPWCLKKDLPCSGRPQHHSLFINCGGKNLVFKGNQYEDNMQKGSPATFISTAEKWAFSSTGIFTSAEDQESFTIQDNSPNTSVLEIYQTARLSPISLKYYGLCLQKGSYKVQLHFAEIMFSNDQTFRSLGRRIFNVSMQGNLVLRDFNIMEEAGGAHIGISKTFDNVNVTGSTLEIHLYWAGKGTNALPDRGDYGPLISAITVTSNFIDTDRGLSVGAIIGIVAASCVLVMFILLALRMSGYLDRKDLEDPELRAIELQTGYFSLRHIKSATGNFDPANKIGEGGFGPVYKGVLSDGRVIAVKQLSSKSKQGNREFINEIGMISALQHPNLVNLYGCCIEGNQLLLVYEYLENNSLARALFGSEEHRLRLDWKTRKKICLGIARGLAYLHEESRLKIVHRDIKATNVLLDKDLNAKISDFGLAKLDEEDNTHISTRIAGTMYDSLSDLILIKSITYFIGYMAPEYAMRGYLTDKADVYSLGVVALEIVSGKSNTNYRPKEESVYLLDWAYVQQEQGNLLELVDPSLGSEYSKEEVMTMLNIALLCTNPSPTLRPTMSTVVSMLEGKISAHAPLVKGSSSEQDPRFKAFEKLTHDSQTDVSLYSHGSHREGVSSNGQLIDSSVSLQNKDDTPKDGTATTALLKDLYDVNLE